MKIIFEKAQQLAENILVKIYAEEHSSEVAKLENYLQAYRLSEKQLIITVNGEVHKILFDSISYIDVFGDYATIHSASQEVTYRKSLSQLTTELSDSRFQRVSRNTILNVDHIEQVTSSFSGNMQAQLKNQTNIIISRKYWKSVKQTILGARE